ncbi:2022_t:CDS:2 [Paraglomus brasilianum]|uniref:RNA polymerase II subunit A C-terminal domain phosphatase SSU72 n=1 Tax=Paraglomus brasilianum TaxID=144538 RepID=A0A9N8ZB69_9GLOM|nr:2022_t:CDS:2 [Paraglomus brasilianum]
MLVSKKGFKVASFGTGSAVRLPGQSIDKPNIYPFGTPYDHIYQDLQKKDFRLYSQNGLLDMLDRNRKIKRAPERWQDTTGFYDVIVTCEERCFDAVCEDLIGRGEERNLPVHIINVEIKDNHEDAMLGGKAILQLAEMVEKASNVDQDMQTILEKWKEKSKYSYLHCVAYF